MYRKVEPEPSPRPTPTIIVPTTTIRETIHKVRWTIRNLKALEKTGTKEIRSPISSVYVKATKKGDNRLHKYVYLISMRYKVILNVDIYRLRIICKPQYSDIDGSLEAMNFNLEPILYNKRSDDEVVYEKTGKDEWCPYKRAKYMEGSFRFEATGEEGVQITAIDGSGTTHSQFAKDGSPNDYGICDAEHVTFQMKGFFKPNFEVELFVKLLQFIED